jgi:hypothetical protein
LYQGRFKAILVEADSYLLELSRYVHLNPVRVKNMEEKSMTAKLQYLVKYKWSSLGGYVGEKDRRKFVEYARILDYVGGDTEKGRRAYRRFVEEGIKGGVESPWEQVTGQVLLGRELFIEKVRKHLERGHVAVREQPAVRALAKRWSSKELIERVAKVLGRKAAELCDRGGGIERAILMECLHRYGQVSQGEIGRWMGGVDYSWVSRMREELRQSIRKDERVRKLFHRVEDVLMTHK